MTADQISGGTQGVSARGKQLQCACGIKKLHPDDDRPKTYPYPRLSSRSSPKNVKIVKMTEIVKKEKMREISENGEHASKPLEL